jgi:microcystin-dependent protein
MGTPFLGEVKIISWNFAPKNWVFCNGQLLPINQNQALFSLLGTTYGGNGTTTFGLPDLRGRVPVSSSGGISLGQVAGQAAHTLSMGEMAAHNHTLNVDATTAATSNTATPTATSVLGQTIGAPASGSAFPVQMYGATNPSGPGLAAATVGANGGSQPHQNMQPYLVLNFVIALNGVFPSRN